MKRLFTYLLLITSLVSYALAESSNTTKDLKLSQENGNYYVVKAGNTNTPTTKMSLIDVAGKQRMLSQRIAKDYLYKGKKVAVSKATKQLQASLGEFNNAHNLLLSSINDPEITNLLTFVKMSVDEFKTITNQPFNLDNAQLALDLSESILEGSQFVVDSLKRSSNVKESEIVARSGKQRMLAQRIAKYYIAYQAGIADKNTVDQMKQAVKDFQENHNFLMRNPTNSAQINQKLKKVEKLWKIVYKFYLQIEKGGLPFIVYTTTDDITKQMDAITKLYTQQYR